MKQPDQMDDDILTADDVATLLHLKLDTIYYKADRDEIPGAFRLGDGERATLRFSKRVLMEWIAKEATRP